MHYRVVGTYPSGSTTINLDTDVGLLQYTGGFGSRSLTTGLNGYVTALGDDGDAGAPSTITMSAPTTATFTTGSILVFDNDVYWTKAHFPWGTTGTAITNNNLPFPLTRVCTMPDWDSAITFCIPIFQRCL